jgi:type IX secretion system PorP/SprF family membrane protein
MKRLLLIGIILLSTLSAFGQQDPLLSNYRFNYFLLNPAAAGSESQWAIKGSYLSSWTRFPGAPVTFTLSANGTLGKKGKSGIGLNIVDDKIGPQLTYGAQAAYAYHLPVGKANLSFGLAARFTKYQLDLGYVRTLQPGDDAVIAKEESLADFAFGIMYYSRKGYVGVSMPQIAQVSGDSALALKMHLYLMGGYKFMINKKGNSWLLEPVALIKYVGADQAILQYDINLRAHIIDQQLMFGVGYRGGLNNNFIAVMAGFNVKQKYQFSYSYDFSLGDFQQYSWGAHEVTMGILVGKKKHDHLAEWNTSGSAAAVEEESTDDGGTGEE